MKNKGSYIVLLVIMLIIGFIICLGFSGDTDKYQYLNSIDYHVEMQKDGSMRVTETWDIDVKDTNTLFKTFNLNKTKYGNIVDVKVKDLQSGEELKEIDREMYHVTEDCYYGLQTNRHTFEIAWGAGMDETSGNRKFQISYTVMDVVTDYKDMQEIYWQFLEKGENAVPAKKVTGTFILPQDVENKDSLKVWGHGQLNGIVEIVDNHTVKFETDNLNPGARLEIRLVTQEEMFHVAENKIRQYSYLPQVIEEEQKWAKEADAKSEEHRNLYIFVGAIYTLIILYFIFKIVKYYKLSKQEGDGVIYKRIQYFRDIPREDATPAEACYLYNFNKKRLNTGDIQSKAVASTILNLCLKKIINLKVVDNEVYVKIVGEKDNLLKDEREIYDLLNDASQGREEIPLSDLNVYAKKKYTKYSQMINNLVNSARNRLYDLKLVDKAKEKEYSKSENAASLKSLVLFAYGTAIITYFISLLPIFKIGIAINAGMTFQASYFSVLGWLLPLVAVATYSWTLKSQIGTKIAVLTQEGADERAKWKGLSNFMKDYSLLDEKKVADLALWEKYLVYATAFGISDKVIEQMKATYPEVFVQETWDENRIEEYPVIYFSTYSVHNGAMTVNVINNIDSSVKTAYKTSMAEISAHSASSSGRRWRIFWWWRRPEAEVAGMGGR